MPTTPARARKWIKGGKAVGKTNKVGVFYVQLLREPSGHETQKIVVGTGISSSGIQPFG
ncbi:RRXRR domain-containing protein [Halotia wernerae UHCC 0503]|nr:RRXRR domain-containing protein [Halotia wernerae UHCC 0503]